MDNIKVIEDEEDDEMAAIAYDPRKCQEMQRKSLALLDKFDVHYTRLIAANQISMLTYTPKKVKHTQEYLDDVISVIQFLERYNKEVHVICRKYPHTLVLMDFLVQYVVLEFEVMKKLRSNQKEVEQRAFALLQFMFANLKDQKYIVFKILTRANCILNKTYFGHYINAMEDQYEKIIKDEKINLCTPIVIGAIWENKRLKPYLEDYGSDYAETDDDTNFLGEFRQRKKKKKVLKRRTCKDPVVVSGNRSQSDSDDDQVEEVKISEEEILISDDDEENDCDSNLVQLGVPDQNLDLSESQESLPNDMDSTATVSHKLPSEGISSINTASENNEGMVAKQPDVTSNALATETTGEQNQAKTKELIISPSKTKLTPENPSLKDTETPKRRSTSENNKEVEAPDNLSSEVLQNSEVSGSLKVLTKTHVAAGTPSEDAGKITGWESLEELSPENSYESIHKASGNTMVAMSESNWMHESSFPNTDGDTLQSDFGLNKEAMKPKNPPWEKDKWNRSKVNSHSRSPPRNMHADNRRTLSKSPHTDRYRGDGSKSPYRNSTQFHDSRRRSYSSNHSNYYQGNRRHSPTHAGPYHKSKYKCYNSKSNNNYRSYADDRPNSQYQYPRNKSRDGFYSPRYSDDMRRSPYNEVRHPEDGRRSGSDSYPEASKPTAPYAKDAFSERYPEDVSKVPSSYPKDFCGEKSNLRFNEEPPPSYRNSSFYGDKSYPEDSAKPSTSYQKSGYTDNYYCDKSTKRYAGDSYSKSHFAEKSTLRYPDEMAKPSTSYQKDSYCEKFQGEPRYSESNQRSLRYNAEDNRKVSPAYREDKPQYPAANRIPPLFSSPSFQKRFTDDNVRSPLRRDGCYNQKNAQYSDDYRNPSPPFAPSAFQRDDNYHGKSRNFRECRKTPNDKSRHLIDDNRNPSPPTNHLYHRRGDIYYESKQHYLLDKPIEKIPFDSSEVTSKNDREFNLQVPHHNERTMPKDPVKSSELKKHSDINVKPPIIQAPKYPPSTKVDKSAGYEKVDDTNKMKLINVLEGQENAFQLNQEKSYLEMECLPQKQNVGIAESKNFKQISNAHATTLGENAVTKDKVKLNLLPSKKLDHKSSLRHHSCALQKEAEASKVPHVETKKPSKDVVTLSKCKETSDRNKEASPRHKLAHDAKNESTSKHSIETKFKDEVTLQKKSVPVVRLEKVDAVIDTKNMENVAPVEVTKESDNSSTLLEVNKVKAKSVEQTEDIQKQTLDVSSSYIHRESTPDESRNLETIDKSKPHSIIGATELKSEKETSIESETIETSSALEATYQKDNHGKSVKQVEDQQTTYSEGVKDKAEISLEMKSSKQQKDDVSSGECTKNEVEDNRKSSNQMGPPNTDISCEDTNKNVEIPSAEKTFNQEKLGNNENSSVSTTIKTEDNCERKCSNVQTKENSGDSDEVVNSNVEDNLEETAQNNEKIVKDDISCSGPKSKIEDNVETTCSSQQKLVKDVVTCEETNSKIEDNLELKSTCHQKLVDEDVSCDGTKDYLKKETSTNQNLVNDEIPCEGSKSNIKDNVECKILIQQKLAKEDESCEVNESIAVDNLEKKPPSSHRKLETNKESAPEKSTNLEKFEDNMSILHALKLKSVDVASKEHSKNKTNSPTHLSKSEEDGVVLENLKTNIVQEELYSTKPKGLDFNEKQPTDSKKECINEAPGEKEDVSVKSKEVTSSSSQKILHKKKSKKERAPSLEKLVETTKSNELTSSKTSERLNVKSTQQKDLTKDDARGNTDIKTLKNVEITEIASCKITEHSHVTKKSSTVHKTTHEKDQKKEIPDNIKIETLKNSDLQSSVPADQVTVSNKSFPIHKTTHKKDEKEEAGTLENTDNASLVDEKTSEVTLSKSAEYQKYPKKENIECINKIDNVKSNDSTLTKTAEHLAVSNKSSHKTTCQKEQKKEKTSLLESINDGRIINEKSNDVVNKSSSLHKTGHQKDQKRERDKVRSADNIGDAVSDKSSALHKSTTQKTHKKDKERSSENINNMKNDNSKSKFADHLDVSNKSSPHHKNANQKDQKTDKSKVNNEVKPSSKKSSSSRGEKRKHSLSDDEKSRSNRSKRLDKRPSPHKSKNQRGSRKERTPEKIIVDPKPDDDRKHTRSKSIKANSKDEIKIEVNRRSSRSQKPPHREDVKKESAPAKNSKAKKTKDPKSDSKETKKSDNIAVNKPQTQEAVQIASSKEVPETSVPVLNKNKAQVKFFSNQTVDVKIDEDLVKIKSNTSRGIKVKEESSSAEILQPIKSKAIKNIEALSGKEEFSNNESMQRTKTSAPKEIKKLTDKEESSDDESLQQIKSNARKGLKQLCDKEGLKVMKKVTGKEESSDDESLQRIKSNASQVIKKVTRKEESSDDECLQQIKSSAIKASKKLSVKGESSDDDDKLSRKIANRKINLRGFSSEDLRFCREVKDQQSEDSSGSVTISLGESISVEDETSNEDEDIEDNRKYMEETEKPRLSKDDIETQRILVNRLKNSKSNDVRNSDFGVSMSGNDVDYLANEESLESAIPSHKIGKPMCASKISGNEDINMPRKNIDHSEVINKALMKSFASEESMDSLSTPKLQIDTDLSTNDSFSEKQCLVVQESKINDATSAPDGLLAEESMDSLKSTPKLQIDTGNEESSNDQCIADNNGDSTIKETSFGKLIEKGALNQSSTYDEEKSMEIDKKLLEDLVDAMSSEQMPIVKNRQTKKGAKAKGKGKKSKSDIEFDAIPVQLEKKTRGRKKSVKEETIQFEVNEEPKATSSKAKKGAKKEVKAKKPNAKKTNTRDAPSRVFRIRRCKFSAPVEETPVDEPIVEASIVEERPKEIFPGPNDYLITLADIACNRLHDYNEQTSFMKQEPPKVQSENDNSSDSYEGKLVITDEIKDDTAKVVEQCSVIKEVKDAVVEKPKDTKNLNDLLIQPEIVPAVDCDVKKPTDHRIDAILGNISKIEDLEDEVSAKDVPLRRSLRSKSSVSNTSTETALRRSSVDSVDRKRTDFTNLFKMYEAKSASKKELIENATKEKGQPCEVEAAETTVTIVEDVSAPETVIRKVVDIKKCKEPPSQDEVKDDSTRDRLYDKFKRNRSVSVESRRSKSSSREKSLEPSAKTKSREKDHPKKSSSKERSTSLESRKKTSEKPHSELKGKDEIQSQVKIHVESNLNSENEISNKNTTEVLAESKSISELKEKEIEKTPEIVENKVIVENKTVTEIEATEVTVVSKPEEKTAMKVIVETAIENEVAEMIMENEVTNLIVKDEAVKKIQIKEIITESEHLHVNRVTKVIVENIAEVVVNIDKAPMKVIVENKATEENVTLETKSVAEKVIIEGKTMDEVMEEGKPLEEKLEPFVQKEVRETKQMDKQVLVESKLKDEKLIARNQSMHEHLAGETKLIDEKTITNRKGKDQQVMVKTKIINEKRIIKTKSMDKQVIVEGKPLVEKLIAESKPIVEEVIVENKSSDEKMTLGSKPVAVEKLTEESKLLNEKLKDEKTIVQNKTAGHNEVVNVIVANNGLQQVSNDPNKLIVETPEIADKQEKRNSKKIIIHESVIVTTGKNIMTQEYKCKPEVEGKAKRKPAMEADNLVKKLKLNPELVAADSADSKKDKKKVSQEKRKSINDVVVMLSSGKKDSNEKSPSALEVEALNTVEIPKEEQEQKVKIEAVEEFNLPDLNIVRNAAVEDQEAIAIAPFAEDGLLSQINKEEEIIKGDGKAEETEAVSLGPLMPNNSLREARSTSLNPSPTGSADYQYPDQDNIYSYGDEYFIMAPEESIICKPTSADNEGDYIANVPAVQAADAVEPLVPENADIILREREREMPQIMSCNEMNEYLQSFLTSIPTDPTPPPPPAPAPPIIDSNAITNYGSVLSKLSDKQPTFPMAAMGLDCIVGDAANVWPQEEVIKSKLEVEAPCLIPVEEPKPKKPIIPLKPASAPPTANVITPEPVPSTSFAAEENPVNLRVRRIPQIPTHRVTRSEAKAKVDNLESFTKRRNNRSIMKPPPRKLPTTQTSPKEREDLSSHMTAKEMEGLVDCSISNPEELIGKKSIYVQGLEKMSAPKRFKPDQSNPNDLFNYVAKLDVSKLPKPKGFSFANPEARPSAASTSSFESRPLTTTTTELRTTNMAASFNHFADSTIPHAHKPSARPMPSSQPRRYQSRPDSRNRGEDLSTNSRSRNDSVVGRQLNTGSLLQYPLSNIRVGNPRTQSDSASKNSDRAWLYKMAQRIPDLANNQQVYFSNDKNDT